LSKKKTSAKWAKLNVFVDLSLRDLTPAEVRVWLVLFRDLKPEGIARAGQADIARRAGLCVRAVGGAVRRLVARGLVEVAHRGRLNGGPSVYRLRGYNPDAPAEQPRGCPTPAPAE
jgi:hypothetical protein